MPLTDGDPDPGPLDHPSGVIYAFVPCGSDTLDRLVKIGALHPLARSNAEAVGQAITQVLNKVLAKYGEDGK